MRTWQDLKNAEEYFWERHKHYVALDDVNNCRKAGQDLLEKHGLYFHEIKLLKAELTKKACAAVRRVIGKGRTRTDADGTYNMFGDKDYYDVCDVFARRCGDPEHTVLLSWRLYRLPHGIQIQVRKVHTGGVFVTFP